MMILDLDPDEAHGYDTINICKLKICDYSISEPLEIIFKFCFEKGQFLMNEKKLNNNANNMCV